MLRKFTSLISEAVNDGHERGINLFMESLETDLRKDMVVEQNTLTGVVGELFENAGEEFDYEEELTEEQIEEIISSMDPYLQKETIEEENKNEEDKDG
ncbi:MAG: hypothetical protein ACOC22_02035 [bacterium]